MRGLPLSAKAPAWIAEQNVALAQRYAHRIVGLASGVSTTGEAVTREQLDGLYFAITHPAPPCMS